MLIPSHRHKPEDLRLWEELEAGDHQADRKRLDRLACESIDAITRFAASPCYISTSWGKDSVVTMHLCYLAGVIVPSVWVLFTGGGGMANPDCFAVRDAYLSSFPSEYHELSFRRDDCLRDEHWMECNRRWGGRRITGIRGDESGSRSISAATHGVRTDRTCRPILRWTTTDVFGYLATRNLPVHPAYAMLGGGRWPREHLRCHSIGGKTATGAGRAQWEREYYGDVLNKLAHSHPA